MSDLGTARGRVVIDTSQLAQAQQQVQSASRTMTQALGSLGVAVGAQQFARFAIEADAVATAFRRQTVAARELAGSQGNVNQLLKVYDQATGGVIGKAQALSDVTRLLAVGFADSAEELDTFVRAVRGISLATGRPQEFIVTNLQLELLNQTGFRLDQIGLGMEEVRRKAAELQSANSSLTREQAYQAAVLETANQKYAKLTRSAEAQATGIERLRKAWADFTLEAGGGDDGKSGANIIFDQWAHDIERATQELQQFLEFLERVERLGRQLQFNLGFRELSPGTEEAVARARARGPAPHNRFSDRPTGAGAFFNAEQTAAMEEWASSVQEIERNAANDRLDATRQYEEQRTNIIRDYEKTIAREAQDFALQRARAEEDYAISLSRIRRDIGNREARQAEELERTIGDARAEAAKRAVDRQEELEERIADAQEDFQRRRERAERDVNERILDAAGRFDAKAIAEAQRDFNKRQRDEQEDFDERLEDLNEAHAKQTEDEKEALEERIQQAKDAYQRQLEDARAADEQRLTDMAADFELRRERENEDRGIRLERLRQDHEDQLGELATQHENRLIQIAEQAQEERDLLDEEFGKSLEALGIRVDKFILEGERATNAAIQQFEKWRAAINNSFMGPVEGPQPRHPLITPGQFPSLGATAPVASTSNSRTSNITVPIQVFGAIGQSPQDIATAVRVEFTNLLRELGE